MNLAELRKYLMAGLLALGAVAMLPACSSTEEAPPPPAGETESGDTGGTTGGTGDLEDCSVYSNQVDIRECEVRNEMRQ